MSNANDVGSISEDGNWIWDGQQWQAYEKTEPVIAAPAMNNYEEFIQATENEFDIIDKNNDGVIDREEYIAKIMEDTLKKKEAEKAPDQIMKIMTIFILIFASCTGFISQKVSSIEAEAGDLNAAADLKIADARATESSENQLLIKEEILLTEAQNLAIEIEGYKNKISTIYNGFNQSIIEYLEPAIEAEFGEFESFGFLRPSELGLLPLEYCFLGTESNQCIVEGYLLSEELFETYAILNISYTTNGGDIDQSFEILHNLLNEGSGFNPVKSELSGSTVYSFQLGMYVYDVDNFLQNPSDWTSYAGSVESLYIEKYALSTIQYNISVLSYYIDALEMDISNYNSAYLEMIEKANYHYVLAEISGEGTFGYNENISLGNSYYENGTNYQQERNNFTDRWLENRTNLFANTSELNSQTEYVGELESIFDQTEDRIAKTLSDSEIAKDKLFETIDELSEIESALITAEGLKSSLLNRSAAYQNGTIDNQTGMYISDEEQNSFTEEVHANSDAKYESAQKDQQEAQEMNDKLTSVSSSVLFISVANMLLGIAGGFATKKEKKKNAMVLLVAGAVSGVIGAIQIVPLL